MPRSRRNLSISNEEDPYTLQRYPLAFQVMLGMQAHNARELVKAARIKGEYLNMYRQPIPAAKVREIIQKTGRMPQRIQQNQRPGLSYNQAQVLATVKYRQMAAGGAFVGYTQAQATAALDALTRRIMAGRP